MRFLNTKSFKWRIFVYCLLSASIAAMLSIVTLILIYGIYFFPTPKNPYVKGAFLVFIFLFYFIIAFFTLIDMYFDYIKKLSKAINHVANGNFDVFVPIEYEDEFGSLANSVNLMAAKLQQSQQIEKETLEKERIAHLAYKEAEKTKNDLITNVAHDLRTPLTSIIGYLQLLKNNQNITKKEQDDYISIAYNKSIRLQKLLDDLFNFSSFSTQKIVYNESKINYSELISQLIDEYYPVFTDNNISVSLDLDNMNLFILGDGELLARVLDNLISNAIKYGKEAGKVDIIVKYDDTSITTKIVNYGVTISKQDLPYIFEKFYRSDASRSSNTGGTGLGLAISKTIIEMHKGEIYAISRALKTSFIFILKREL